MTTRLTMTQDVILIACYQWLKDRGLEPTLNLRC